MVPFPPIHTLFHQGENELIKRLLQYIHLQNPSIKRLLFQLEVSAEGKDQN